jgi:hypothetical protein
MRTTIPKNFYIFMWILRIEHDKHFQLIVDEKIMCIWAVNKNMKELSISRENIEITHTLKLNLVCEIEPKKDKSGQIFEYDFQEFKDTSTGLQFSQHGGGPFCRFSIPNGYSGKPGVYFIFENQTLRYIGKCKDLAIRFNLNYGIIELRNCLHKGQRTNCRINNQILCGVKEKKHYFLYFFETPSMDDLETKLIVYYHPPWNLTHTNSQPTQPIKEKILSVPISHSGKITSCGKYQNLFQALKSCKSKDITLTYPEIEKILGFKLPDSAYKYQPWWANDTTHSQAKAWLNADWRVVRVNLGKSTKFSTDNVKI